MCIFSQEESSDSWALLCDPQRIAITWVLTMLGHSTLVKYKVNWSIFLFVSFCIENEWSASLIHAASTWSIVLVLWKVMHVGNGNKQQLINSRIFHCAQVEYLPTDWSINWLTAWLLTDVSIGWCFQTFNRNCEDTWRRVWWRARHWWWQTLTWMNWKMTGDSTVFSGAATDFLHPRLLSNSRWVFREWLNSDLAFLLISALKWYYDQKKFCFSFGFQNYVN